MFKNIKFEKSKYPIIKIAFWIILFCVVLMVLMINKKNAYYLNIKNHNQILKPITLNLELNRQMEDKFFVCFNDYCEAPKSNSLMGEKAKLAFVYSSSFDYENEDFYRTKINNVYFAYPKNAKNIENKIKEVNLYIGDESYHYNFSQLEKLENKVVSIVSDEDSKAQEYKIYKFENSNNYIGLKNHLITLFLSLFYNWKVYIIPYIWLFISLLAFLLDKDSFKMSNKLKGSILSSFLVFIIVSFSVVSLIYPKVQNDEYLNYILKDAINYSKTHKIHILSDEKDFENRIKLDDVELNYHQVDTSKEKLSKIDSKEYVKNNEKAIIYFDSNVVNIDMVSLVNARAKLYKTNNGMIGKITY